MRSQKEQNKLNHSSQPGRAPDLDFTITERDPTSTASLASQLSSHCGYYYGRTALSLSLLTVFSLQKAEMEKSEEVRGGGWGGSFSPLSGSGNNNKSLASPATSLTQILQQNGNINLVSLYLSLSLSLSVSLPLSLQLCPLLMKIVMRSIHIILPVSFLPPGLASPVSLHAGIPSI